MELTMLFLDMLHINLNLYNSDNFLLFYHSLYNIILISLMYHMTLLSNPVELSMLFLDMLHMDLTLYNSDNLLEFHHSISEIILINMMCYMTLLSSPMELSLLFLDMLHMDLTMYNSNNILELHNSIFIHHPNQFDVSHDPLEHLYEAVHALLGYVAQGLHPVQGHQPLGVPSLHF
jgi:hypothetical protein